MKPDPGSIFSALGKWVSLFSFWKPLLHLQEEALNFNGIGSRNGKPASLQICLGFPVGK
jgi:hypothetical protein